MSSNQVYTISQISSYVKTLFTADDVLTDVWVTGEVSNFKLHTSGHCYLTLKDATSSLKAVIWRTAASRLALPRDGDAITAHGAISVYEQQGVYQLYIDHLEPVGVGRLWQEFERLKGRLDAEGLFDPTRKRSIPTRPQRVGIVTSATAAALRDILRTIAERFPLAEVILAPTQVQGEQAPSGIVAALSLLNRWSASNQPLDVIIVARGGGSIEELWAFNDERVARAIAGSTIPVITGIGHETDFTIADFVADVRAPTPTGAATLATPDSRELSASVNVLASRLRSLTANRVATAMTILQHARHRLVQRSPATTLARDRQQLDDLAHRAGLAIAHRLVDARHALDTQRIHLSDLDPQQVLHRGFAIVNRDDVVITSRQQVSPGDRLTIRVADGAFQAIVAQDSN